MCTVTIIPLVGPDGKRFGLRLATNRDESRRRPPAEPPRIREQSGVRSIWPVDPAGGGTWVGVNEAGLIATLLNRNVGSPKPTHPAARSRGEIIPMLLEQTDAAQAARLIAELNPTEFLPFTIVLTDGDTLIHGAAQGENIRIVNQSLSNRPVMFTSSGLGDALVDPPRRQLFNDWFGDDSRAWPQLQDGYHAHRWPHAMHLSVCMSREDARTVSCTVIETSESVARLSYWGQAPGEPGDPVRCELPLRGAVR